MSATDISGKTDRHYHLLRQLSDELMEIAAGPDARLETRAPEVSGWSIAEHLDHLAVSNLAIVDGMMAGLDTPPTEAASRLKLVGRIVLLTGFIPRGVGQAPELSLPRSDSLTEVRARLTEAAERVADLEGRLPEVEDADWRIDHPYFGGLTPLKWLRFMIVHTRHHLKIIGDIEDALPGSLGSNGGAGESGSGKEQPVA